MVDRAERRRRARDQAKRVEDLGLAEVVMELGAVGGSDWHRVGSASEVEPVGSISTPSTPSRPRQVYVFGWYEGVAGVWLSVGGVDIANSLVREIYALDLKRLSDLSEPLVLEYPADPPALLRFRLVTRSTSAPTPPEGTDV